jgi:hypothetical protein
MSGVFVRSLSLAVLAVVAVVGGSMLTWPGQAAAAENLLADKPSIGTVRAMIPQRGRDAGRLVVWVRVDHAPGTLRGVLRERPETVHTGRVTARVAGASRIASGRLDLDTRWLPGGYFLRFPNSTGRAMASGAARRVSVSLRVAQTVDVDSDGDNDDRAGAATTRRVELATPANTIEPKDGRYQNLDSATDYLRVAGGQVVHYFFLASLSPCGVGPADNVHAPIDPQTGQFSFANTAPGADPPVTTVVNGRFRDTTSSVVDAAITSGDCTYGELGDFDLVPGS